jgi:hypothetical protein
MNAPKSLPAVQPNVRPWTNTPRYVAPGIGLPGGPERTYLAEGEFTTHAARRSGQGLPDVGHNQTRPKVGLQGVLQGIGGWHQDGARIEKVL